MFSRRSFHLENHIHSRTYTLETRCSPVYVIRNPAVTALYTKIRKYVRFALGSGAQRLPWWLGNSWSRIPSLVSCWWIHQSNIYPDRRAICVRSAHRMFALFLYGSSNACWTQITNSVHIPGINIPRGSLLYVCVCVILVVLYCIFFLSAPYNSQAHQYWNIYIYIFAKLELFSKKKWKNYLSGVTRQYIWIGINKLK